MKQLILAGILLLAFTRSNAQDVGPVLITDDEVKQIDDMVKYYEQQGLFNGVILVAQKGKIYYHKATGFSNLEKKQANETSTQFGLESVSKSITAIAILQLKEKGKLNLDEPIKSYLPGLKDEISDFVTIRQLLQHTAGLPASFVSSYEHVKRSWSRRKLMAQINNTLLVYTPGSKHSYSNIGYQMLAMIIEEISGQQFSQYLKEEIFEPAGMTHTSLLGRGTKQAKVAKSYSLLSNGFEKTKMDNSDFIKGAGGIYTTAEDLHLLDRALYDDKLLSAASINEMFSKGSLSNYGFGWSIWDYYISGDERKSVSNEGGGPSGTAVVSRWLNDEVLIIAMSNMRHSQADGLRGKVASIIAGAPGSKPAEPMEFKLVETLLNQDISAALEFEQQAAESGNYRNVSSGSLNRLAYQYLRSSRIKESLKIFKLYVTLFPTSSYAYDGYAEALAIDNQEELSMLNYKKALILNYSNTAARHVLMKKSLNPESMHDPVIKEITGWTELFIQDLNSSKIKQMLKTSDHSESFIAAVATNLFRHEQATQGNKLFLFNVKAFPNSSNAWYNHGRGLHALDQKEGAISAYQKSLELNPENNRAKRMLEVIKN